MSDERPKDQPAPKYRLKQVRVSRPLHAVVIGLV
jgi:hypothetical protein